MFFFILCSGFVTVLAVVLCVFSSRQQRAEDKQIEQKKPTKKMERERRDWDVLNNWDQ